MLHRADPEGIIAISQPAHAWLSGQLAREWGSSEFSPASEEVCLAAEQHDIGYLDWEREPTLNPETGLPYTFLEMPRKDRLAIWKRGIHQMLRFGRYPALLVSMHYTWLANRNQRECPPEEQAWVDEFVKEQDEFQTSLKTSLSNDFYYGPLTCEQSIQRDQELVSMWDWISLLLCHRLTKETVIERVPTRIGTTAVKLTPKSEDGAEVEVSPWPFSEDKVKLVFEGRRLLKAYHDERHLREAVRAAAQVTIITQLITRR